MDISSLSLPIVATAGKRQKTNLQKEMLGRAPSFGILFVRLVIPLLSGGRGGRDASLKESLSAHTP